MWFRRSSDSSDTDSSNSVDTTSSSSSADATTDTEFKMKIGPLVITYYQIYTSIASSIIIAPVSFILVYIFKYTNPTDKTFKEAIQDFKDYKRRKMINHGMQTESMDTYDDEEPEFSDGSAEYVWHQTKYNRYPYVALYFAWGLCFVASFVSAFFTVMYSLYWGGDDANKWLAGFVLTAFQSITIVGTAQVRPTTKAICTDFFSGNSNSKSLTP